MEPPGELTTSLRKFGAKPQRGEELLLVSDLDLPGYRNCRGVGAGEGGGPRGVGGHEGRDAERHSGGGRKSANGVAKRVHGRVFGPSVFPVRRAWRWDSAHEARVWEAS